MIAFHSNPATANLSPTEDLATLKAKVQIKMPRLQMDDELIQSEPSGSIAKKSSSVRTATPSCSAFANFEPAPGPATT